MFGSTFYHESIRKVVVAFGSLFDEIAVQRRDSSGNVSKRILVPIMYAPKEKFVQMLNQYPTLRDGETHLALFCLAWDFRSPALTMMVHEKETRCKKDLKHLRPLVFTKLNMQRFHTILVSNLLLLRERWTMVCRLLSKSYLSLHRSLLFL